MHEPCDYGSVQRDLEVALCGSSVESASGWGWEWGVAIEGKTQAEHDKGDVEPAG